LTFKRPQRSRRRRSLPNPSTLPYLRCTIKSFLLSATESFRWQTEPSAVLRHQSRMLCINGLA
jgi:hypothetical protein